MSVVVIVPTSVNLGGTAGDVRTYDTAGDLRLRVRELDGAKAVIYHDGFSAVDQSAIAAAVRDSGATCIEVRAHRWDGFEPSPLSSACTGVISGFGTDGIARAVAALAD